MLLLQRCLPFQLKQRRSNGSPAWSAVDEEYGTDSHHRYEVSDLHPALVFSLGLLMGLSIVLGHRALMAERGHFLYNAQEGEKAAATTSDLVSSADHNITNCGNDWREAKALGCHYDIMASRWYTADCYHEDVMDAMLQDVDFQWYEDANHTIPMSLEKARTGEFEMVFPLHNYHVAHCMYLWRKLHWSLLEHRHIDEDIYDLNHTLHCTKFIMDWPRIANYGLNSTTAAFTFTPACRRDPL